MGDELALRNDTGYLADPERAPDNRWMHRPPMDWTAAARRDDPATLEGRVFAWLRRLGLLRGHGCSPRAQGSAYQAKPRPGSRTRSARSSGGPSLVSTGTKPP